MTISFRTRLFVIAALIVTVVIAAVMLIGWNRVLAFEAIRLERQMCLEARRLATQALRTEDIPRMINDVLGKLYLKAAEQLMVRFEPREAEQGWASENWQPALLQTATRWHTSENATEAPLAVATKPPQRKPNLTGNCALTSVSIADKPWRVVRFTHREGTSILAVDLIATQREIQNALRQAFVLVVPLALVFTALGAWLLSALMMRPVNRLRKAMQVVTQKALDQRLPSVGEDREFKVLIDAYNTMLSRLELSFQQASRFSADAAHELKTPLTILQGRIEESLHQTQDQAMQEQLVGLLDEVGRLSDITRKLLLLSQADAGYLALQHININLSQMLSDMAADTQMLLTDQTLHCAIDRDLLIDGDELLLRQLLNNLISNAVRYCLAGGWIRLTARALPSGVEVVFSNATHIIAPDHRARFFDRFYRGDAAHSRRVDGNGLGLSLAREIARAHGGDLILVAGAPTEVTVQLTLPLNSQQQQAWTHVKTVI